MTNAPCSIARCIAVSVLLLATQPVSAGWTGGVEGGTVVQDAGNANRLRLVLRNDDKPLSHLVFAEWLRFGSDRNSYSVGYNPRYWYNPKYYVFGESEFRTDDAFGVDQELKLLGGVGGQFISTPIQSLYAEVGIGGRSVEFQGQTDTVTESFGVIRSGYVRTFAEMIKLDLNVSGIRSTERVTDVSSEAGLALRISGGSVRVAYRSQYRKSGSAESISQDDTFISYGYSF